MKSALLVALAALVTVACEPSGSSQTVAENPLSFTQRGPSGRLMSERFTLHSKHVGADYVIQVAAPERLASATAEDLAKVFPVKDARAVYVLDGEPYFQWYSDADRSAFIVSVSAKSSILEKRKSRWRDFVHVQAPKAPAPPGGAKFAAFLTDELKPYIEGRLPVDPKKSVLGGYSLSGLFALRLLADKPDAFSGYLIGDPSINFDPAVIETIGKAAMHAQGQKVFLGVAELSAPDAYWDDLRGALQTPGSGFVVEVVSIPGKDHGTARPFVVSRGLHWLLSSSSR